MFKKIYFLVDELHLLTTTPCQVPLRQVHLYIHIFKIQSFIQIRFFDWLIIWVD